MSTRTPLYLAGSLLGLALGGGAAHAATPRVVSVPKSQAPKAANRPAGTKVSCNRPGSHPSDKCPVIKLGDVQVWAFSYRNNSYGFELAAYRGGKLLGHTRAGGARYLEGARVNRRARTVDFIGQGGRPATVSFAELERLARVTPNAAPPAAAKAPGQRCATEGGHCRFQGRGVVYYGANGRFAKRKARDGIACNNQTFGDPIRGVRKACFVTVTQAPPPPARTPRGRRCAEEGGRCEFQGRATVVYGANGKYATRRARGRIDCNNATFGDPIVGVRKACFVDAPPPRAARRPRGERRRRVALKTHHGKYVVAEANGQANANRGRIGPWEVFTLVPQPGGKVCLLGHHGKYLVAEKGGAVNANRGHCREWERWAVIRHRDGSRSFRSHHGKYLVAEGDGRLNANRPHMKEWERFRLVRR